MAAGLTHYHYVHYCPKLDWKQAVCGVRLPGVAGASIDMPVKVVETPNAEQVTCPECLRVMARWAELALG